MKIGMLRIGQVDSFVSGRIQEDLKTIFPETTCALIRETFTIPEKAFNKTRGQYSSSILLTEVSSYAEKEESFESVLGIVDVDIFVSGLNFVFGEAGCPGKAALISLWRLRPEFYEQSPDMELFAERSVKEAVHELGHTLGLRHCSNPYCVMYFSNSIFETDRKRSLFCNRCRLIVEKIVQRLKR